LKLNEAIIKNVKIIERRMAFEFMTKIRIKKKSKIDLFCVSYLIEEDVRM